MTIRDFDEHVDTGESERQIPWVCVIKPRYYDVHGKAFLWEGWAINADDALTQAMAAFDVQDESDDEVPTTLDDVAVHLCQVDFRRFAGPLIAWMRAAGGLNHPLWELLRAAVNVAGLPTHTTNLRPLPVYDRGPAAEGEST